MAVFQKKANNIEMVQGSTAPFNLILKTSGTGSTFEMFVDKKADPEDATFQIMNITGALDADDDKLVAFTPSALEAASDPGLYYFQVKRTKTSSGAISFPARGTLRILNSLDQA